MTQKTNHTLLTITLIVFSLILPLEAYEFVDIAMSAQKSPDKECIGIKVANAEVTQDGEVSIGVYIINYYESEVFIQDSPDGVPSTFPDNIYPYKRLHGTSAGKDGKARRACGCAMMYREYKKKLRVNTAVVELYFSNTNELGKIEVEPFIKEILQHYEIELADREAFEKSRYKNYSKFKDDFVFDWLICCILDQYEETETINLEHLGNSLVKACGLNKKLEISQNVYVSGYFRNTGNEFGDTLELTINYDELIEPDP